MRLRIFGSKQGISDRQKAAALLFAIGPELSAAVLKELNETEIEVLVSEIPGVRKLPWELTASIIREFYDLYEAWGLIAQGGLDRAIDVLERSFGKDKAREILQRLTASHEPAPFHFLRDTDPGEIVQFLEDEHPQTIALVLTYLQPEQASAIVRQLEPHFRVEVIKRILLMDRVAPDIIAEVETVLESKASSSAQGVEHAITRGIEVAVKILHRLDRRTEREILKALEDEKPQLVEELWRKLFTFEDIADLEDCVIQRVMEEIGHKKFALALKTVDEDIKERVLSNMSQEAEAALREHMEFLGPVRLKDVEQAQREIIDTVYRLDEDDV